MINRQSVLIVLGAAAFMLATAAGSSAFFVPGHMNNLRFTRSVALPGVVLAAGAYSFDLANSNDIVRVSTREGHRVVFMGFVRRVPRPSGLAKDVLTTFGEAAPGQPIPLEVWYPIHDASGYAFVNHAQ